MSRGERAAAARSCSECMMWLMSSRDVLAPAISLLSCVPSKHKTIRRQKEPRRYGAKPAGLNSLCFSLISCLLPTSSLPQFEVRFSFCLAEYAMGVLVLFQGYTTQRLSHALECLAYALHTAECREDLHKRANQNSFLHGLREIIGLRE